MWMLFASLLGCADEGAPPDAARLAPSGATPPPESAAPPTPSTSPGKLPAFDACTADADCVPAPWSCSCPDRSVNWRELENARRSPFGSALGRCASSGRVCKSYECLCMDGTCAVVHEGDPRYRPRR